MYHAACKVEFQLSTVVLTADVFQLFTKLFNNYTSIRSGQKNRRQLALSSAIPQGKQPTMHGVWSSTAGTYVLRPV